MSINSINGNTGIYTSSMIPNSSVRYGMNAASSMEKYSVEGVSSVGYSSEPAFLDDEIFVKAVESFAAGLEKDAFTPLKYRYKYSSGETVDKLSLMGAAYEEMGKKKEVPVDEFNAQLQKVYPGKNNGETAFNSKVLDTNDNDLIETDEYAAFLALADIKSKDKNSESTSIMDGNITDEGIKEATSYLAVNHEDMGTRSRLVGFMQGIFSKIQTELKLKETKEEFYEKTKELDFLA